MNSLSQLAILLPSVGLCAIALSHISVAGIRHWTEKRHILDIPNERSSHTAPTPRGGGLAIVLLTVLSAWALYLSGVASISGRALAVFTVGGSAIAAVSWVDDIRSLPNRVRFGIHSLGAILVLVFLGPWLVIDCPPFGSIPVGWWGIPLTFLWIVGLTNAYNFMDGIDGIAGAQAALAGMGWAIVGGIYSQPLVALLGVLLCGSSLGFLCHNWAPARIFMGDVGSAFLGYTFAVLPVLFSASGGVPDHPGAAPLLGVLLVWPFFFDAFYTFLRRLARRENVFAAHRSHLYQRLVIAGYSHRTVASLYLGLAGLGLILALAYPALPAVATPGVFLTLLLAATALVKGVSRVESSKNPTVSSRGAR